jgi:hypothetical protein
LKGGKGGKGGKKMSSALAPPFSKVDKIKLKYFSNIIGYAINCIKSVKV